jgi:hypothetical protein
MSMKNILKFLSNTERWALLRARKVSLGVHLACSANWPVFHRRGLSATIASCFSFKLFSRRSAIGVVTSLSKSWVSHSKRSSLGCFHVKRASDVGVPEERRLKGGTEFHDVLHRAAAIRSCPHDFHSKFTAGCLCIRSFPHCTEIRLWRTYLIRGFYLRQTQIGIARKTHSAC